MNQPASRTPSLISGWREWVALPEMGIDRLEAKIDTGAKASTLHAIDIEPFEKNGEKWVKFVTNPQRGKVSEVVRCEAKVREVRRIRSSIGDSEQRFVIVTPVCMGSFEWPIELTLTARTRMEYRMLLGRAALGRNFLVNPLASHLQAEPTPANARVLQTKHHQLSQEHV